MTNGLLARIYPESSFGGFTRLDGMVAFYSRVQALVRPGDLVLDIGCGRGGWNEDPSDYRRRLHDLRGERRLVIGIDVDVAAARNPGINEFRQIKDLRRWPIADMSVDLAVSDYVLEHVQDPASFLAEAWRVLKPGGHLCVRTPNAFGYVALAARMIPSRLHARIVSAVQERRQEEDVFPTVYRCNTRRKMRQQLSDRGFECCVLTMDAEPGYAAFSGLAFRALALVTPLFPPMFRSTLYAFARKPGGEAVGKIAA